MRVHLAASLVHRARDVLVEPDAVPLTHREEYPLLGRMHTDTDPDHFDPTRYRTELML